MTSINYEIKDLLERIETKLDDMNNRLIRVEDAQTYTNGKVRFLHKALWGLGGAILTVAGWLVAHLVQSI